MRLLSNYFVATLDRQHLSALFSGKPMPGSNLVSAAGDSTAGNNSPPWKVEALIAEVVDGLIDLNNRQPPTDGLYAELVTFLLVLCSTQVYHPSASRAHPNYFLDILLERFTCAHHIGLVDLC